MTTRLLDLLALVALAMSGAAFLEGARALAEKQDLHALYWMGVGGVLARATSQLARADRVSG